MSGFRKGHSTAIALLGILDDLKCTVNRDGGSMLVFTDYPKFFDNVGVATALSKIHLFTPFPPN